ncbi:MAG TPA: chorismate mutase [Xylella taiwanensis]
MSLSSLLRRNVHLAAFIISLSLFGYAGQARSVPTALTTLLRTVVARNAIGDEVALSKWDSGKAVLDTTREAAVLQNVRDQAPQYSLDPDLAVRFFSAQIEANKLVQYQLLNHWQLRGKAPNRIRPDLIALRDRLDHLQIELLDALAQNVPLREQSNCPSDIARATETYAQQSHLDNIHRVALIRSFGDFCH